MNQIKILRSDLIHQLVELFMIDSLMKPSQKLDKEKLYTKKQRKTDLVKWISWLNVVKVLCKLKMI